MTFDELIRVGWEAQDAGQLAAACTLFRGAIDAKATLGGEMRQRMSASALLDAARFTRELENAYRQAWRRYVET